MPMVSASIAPLAKSNQWMTPRHACLTVLTTKSEMQTRHVKHVQTAKFQMVSKGTVLQTTSLVLPGEIVTAGKFSPQRMNATLALVV